MIEERDTTPPPAAADSGWESSASDIAMSAARESETSNHARCAMAATRALVIDD